MSEAEKKSKNTMLVISAAIIRYRAVIFLLFAVFGVYCAVNFGRGGSNADLTAFLAPTTETRRGLSVMEEEFAEYATADLMIGNITFERAEALSGQIAACPHVSAVEFDRGRAHYANASALFQVTFDGEADEETTQFLLMPGLIALFPHALKKTAHPTLIPDVRPWGKVLMKSGYCFVWLFLLLLPAAFHFSSETPYAFYDPEITELRATESRSAMHRIDATFAPSSRLALLVPREDFAKECRILEQAAALPGIKRAQGLANTEAEPGHMLTELYTPRMFAELAELDIEQATFLFQAYGVRHEQYQAILQRPDSYAVPLVEVLLYLFELADKGVVAPDSREMDMIDELRGEIARGVEQLRGEHWNRLVFTVELPADSPEANALVEQIRGIAEAEYGRGSVLLAGDITGARDLSASFDSDPAPAAGYGPPGGSAPRDPRPGCLVLGLGRCTRTEDLPEYGNQRQFPDAHRGPCLRGRPAGVSGGGTVQFRSDAHREPR